MSVMSLKMVKKILWTIFRDLGLMIYVFLCKNKVKTYESKPAFVKPDLLFQMSSIIVSVSSIY